MWKWEGRQIEGIHSFIQWLFPLDEPSANNFRAPILTKDEIVQFRTDVTVRDNMMMSLCIMLKYYGFTLDPDGETIQKADDFEARSGATWLFVYPSTYRSL
jgi:hypothetical protein